MQSPNEASYMPIDAPQADKNHLADTRSPRKKLLALLAEDQKDIIFIYIYAIFTALMSLALPLGIQGIVTRISGGLIFESVYVLIGLVVVTTIISGILQVMQIRLVEVLQRRIFARTAFNMTLSLLRLRFDALRGTHLPELMNRFFDVITLQKGLPKLLIDLSAAFVQIVVGLMLLAFYHPLFLFFTLFLVFFVYALFTLTGSEAQKTSLKESTYKYKVAFWLEELARVVRPARLYNPEEAIRQTDEHVAHYLVARQKHFKVLVQQYAWIVVFKVLVVAGLLVLGVELVAQAQISLGQFVASELIVVTIISALEKIIMNMDTIYDLLAGVEKISHVVGLEPETVTGNARLPERKPKKGATQAALAGVHIDIRNLTTTDSSGRRVLTGYDAQIAPGRLHVMDVIDQETINVLTDILLSAHEDYTGLALADGIPIRELDNYAWRQNVSLYTGATDLLTGTIESNLRLVSPHGQYAELLVWLRRLGAEEAYLSQPLGLETPILPLGRNLEGMLAEALPLAMRLLAHPRLLIVRDHVRFVTQPQKERFIEILAAYARQHTVVVFSGDNLWNETTRRVHELTTPQA